MEGIKKRKSILRGMGFKLKHENGSPYMIYSQTVNDIYIEVLETITDTPYHSKNVIEIRVKFEYNNKTQVQSNLFYIKDLEHTFIDEEILRNIILNLIKKAKYHTIDIELEDIKNKL